MTAIGRVVITTLFGALSVWAAVGCREKTPAPSHNYDLSEDDVALLPTGSPTKNASYGNVQKNRADWVAFRDPADVAKAPSGKPAAAKKPGEISGELAVELKDIVTDYNDVVADADVEGMLEYFVEEQQAAAERYFDAAMSLGGAVAKLRESLSGSDADAGSPTNAPAITLLDRLAPASSLMVSIESMERTEQGKIVGRLAAKAGVVPSLDALEFSLIDDEWFFRIASPAKVEGWVGSAEQATKDLASLLDLPKDEAGGRDGLLSKLRAAATGLLIEEAQPTDEQDTPNDAGGAGEQAPGANSDGDDDGGGDGDEDE